MSQDAVRWSAIVAAVLGGSLWTVSWLLNVSLTNSSGEETRLGFSEGEARALLNPAIVLFAFCVVALRQRFASPVSAQGTLAPALAIAGLALMLLGNLMEFGFVGSSPIESEDPGFFVFTLGLLATAGGLATLALFAIRSGTVPIAQKLGLAFLPVSVFLPSFGVAWLLWSYLPWSTRAPRET